MSSDWRDALAETLLWALRGRRPGPTAKSRPAGGKEPRPAGGPREPAAGPPAPRPEPEVPPFLPGLATSLWRLERALPPEGKGGAEDMRRIRRHVAAMRDILAEAGLEIQDHTGALFDSGLRLKTLAFQPTPGLERETVIETIKPSLYLAGRPIQTGEVIVGRPEAPAAQPAQAPAGGPASGAGRTSAPESGEGPEPGRPADGERREGDKGEDHESNHH